MRRTYPWAGRRLVLNTMGHGLLVIIGIWLQTARLLKYLSSSVLSIQLYPLSQKTLLLFSSPCIACKIWLLVPDLAHDLSFSAFIVLNSCFVLHISSLSLNQSLIVNVVFEK